MKIQKKKTVSVIQTKPIEHSAYAVGYGRPPLHTRFQPGKSGNPKGRTKGHKNFNTLLRQTLSQQVEVVKSGTKHKMSKNEILIEMLVNKALQGDMRAINILLPYILQMEQAERELAQKVAALSQNDKEILSMYASRIKK